MDYHVVKTRLNNFYSRYVGGTSRPTFFNISEFYPSLNTLADNYSLIKEEFQTAYRLQPNMPLYHEIDPGESEISNTTGSHWKVFMLYLLGHRSEQNCLICPKTSQLLAGIPNIIQAFFSILEPGKSIPLHEGPYLGYLRYHLGLQVPSVNPPSLYVNSKEYIWREGEGVLFDDSWPHEVVNHSTELRAVLIVDVLRPMPTLPSALNKLVTNVVAKYTYGRKVINKVRGYAVKDEPLIT